MNTEKCVCFNNGISFHLISTGMTCVCMLSRFSRVQLFATLWSVACQDPLSMGFSRQEYWSGLLCFLHGIFPAQGLNSRMSPTLAGGFFATSAIW